MQLEDCKRDLARLAVVEANWQYLKTELEVANKSVATGKLQVNFPSKSAQVLCSE